MIEIRELSVKVNVNSESQNERTQRNGAPSRIDKKAIINECLERVSDMLKNKNER
jgi:hypothetical protein